MSDILQQIADLTPEIAAIAAAVNPKIASTVQAAEAAILALTPLVNEFNALRGARGQVSPALWAQIVASNVAADAAVAAAAPKD